MEWNLEHKLEQMEAVENSILDIIATFIRQKKLKITNAKQLAIVIGRYSKTAKLLSGAYTNDEIIKAMKQLNADNERRHRKGEEEFAWTLETVMKQLTK